MKALYVHRIGDPGASEPIVALHGVRGWGGRWNAIPGLDAYAPDLRGHGESPRVGTWTISQHVTDVVQTMDALGLKRVRLLGLSFGGSIALHLSLAAPDRVARLLLLDPAIEVERPLVQKRLAAVRPVPMFSDQREAYARRAAIWSKADAALIRQEVERHLEQGDNGRWRWRYETEAAEKAFQQMSRPAPDALPPVPTALVIAARGSLVGSHFVERLRSAGTPIETIDSSHNMEVDNPAAVAEMIHRLLPAPDSLRDNPR